MQTRHCDHPSHRKEDTPQTAVVEVAAWKWVKGSLRGRVVYKRADSCDQHLWFFAKKFWDDEICEQVNVSALVTYHRCETCYDYVIDCTCRCTGARRYPR